MVLADLEPVLQSHLVLLGSDIGFFTDLGNDWGQQGGLQMGPRIWRKFIFPVLKRMYGVVKEAGKRLFIHSCGDVDELFDDLIAIGLDCFNPFQPGV
jgi:uroporphyrinogen decarboxylase